LEPEQNAGGFKNRRFPLPISPEEKIKAWNEFDPKRLEAAKIPELKFGEHGELYGRDGALRRPQRI
jgi:hypothetical protein